MLAGPPPPPKHLFHSIWFPFSTLSLLQREVYLVSLIFKSFLAYLRIVDVEEMFDVQHSPITFIYLGGCH